MAQRVTQVEVVTLLDNPDTKTRVTQVERVTLLDNPDSKTRVTQMVRVVLVENIAQDAFATDSQWVGW